MSTKIRENFLVGSGNQALYPAGQPVFDHSNSTGAAPTSLVPVGQFVFYDPSTELSINTATWSKSTHGRFVLGVGDDPNGVGYATHIRKAFGEIFYGCHINSMHTDCSSCGLQQVQDVFIKGCVDVDEPISIKFTVLDHDSNVQFGYQVGPSKTVTAQVSSELCNACSEEADPTKLINALWQQLKPQIGRPSRLTNLKRGTFPEDASYKYPFTITPLYTTSYNYVLTDVSGSCTGCLGSTPLQSIVIDGDTVTFSSSVRSVVETVATSTYGQLQLAVKQINKALNGKGSAVLKKSTGCCDYDIEVNTCLPMGNLTVGATGNTTTVSPTTSSPFQTIDGVNDSFVCDNDSTSFTPTAGFRVITDPIVFEDSCFVNLAMPKWLKREVRITTAHAYQTNFPFYIKEKQAATEPRGLGLSWAVREYKSDNGGSGRNHNGYNEKFGYWGLPGKNDRANAGRVNPRDNYASIVIDHSYMSSPNEHIGYMNKLHGRTVLLVPQDNTTTKTALETAFNNYITGDVCNPLPAIDFC